MIDIKAEIINYIRRNRVSTTEVADCLNKSGCIEGIMPINRGHFSVGNVFWAYAYGESNWDVHEQLQMVGEGDIVFVEEIDCKNRAIFGELVSKYLILYKQAAAIVVDGNVRDANNLIKENWPIWCRGLNPVGCFNEKVNIEDAQKAFITRNKDLYDGAIAVCDDCGVVIITKEYHTKEFYSKLEFIEEQEDIWFDCIDRLKMSTFETVCLKKYKNLR